MRGRPLASGVPPGDLKSPDLPIVEAEPLLASLRNCSLKPKKPHRIAMTKPAAIDAEAGGGEDRHDDAETGQQQRDDGRVPARECDHTGERA